VGWGFQNLVVSPIKLEQAKKICMDVTLYKHIPHSLTCNEKFEKKKREK